MKEIPKKNYIILAVILIFSTLFVFYLRGWYNTSKEYYSKNSEIKDVVREINQQDIDNYILESPKFILYTSSGQDSNIKQFENGFKKLIKKTGVQEDILYLNLDNVDKNEFNDYLQSKLSTNEKTSSQISEESSATVYVFDNGKIKDVLTNVNNYSAKQIETFFKKWGFRND